jgi:hypothetical protein
MSSFAWDAIMIAFITGGLGLVGVLVTVHGARRSSTQQHVEQTSHLLEQTSHLVTILSKQKELTNKVEHLSDNQDTLFNMLVEVDQKVTGHGNNRNGLRSVRSEVVDI